MKRRGEGIGFAGVGITAVASRVITKPARRTYVSHALASGLASSRALEADFVAGLTARGHVQLLTNHLPC
jgi:hypothetical protein